MSFKTEFMIYVALFLISSLVFGITGVRELFYGKQSDAVVMLLISVGAAFMPYVLIRIITGDKGDDSSDERE